MAILSSLVARCFAFQLGHVPAGALVVVGFRRARRRWLSSASSAPCRSREKIVLAVYVSEGSFGSFKSPWSC